METRNIVVPLPIWRHWTSLPARLQNETHAVQFRNFRGLHQLVDCVEMGMTLILQQPKYISGDVGKLENIVKLSRKRGVESRFLSRDAPFILDNQTARSNYSSPHQLL